MEQATDSATPMGRAMIQMASVFGEQERQIIRSRVLAGLNRVGKARSSTAPRCPPRSRQSSVESLSAGNGILKVAALAGVGSEKLCSE